jgi:uncharacterized protein (DUF1330 family)
MSYVVVRLTVEDAEKWKAGFQQAAPLRKSYGSKGARAFINADNPNEVLVLGEYEDAAKAREMFQSQEFRDATKRAGVIGKPEVVHLNEALQLPA